VATIVLASPGLITLGEAKQLIVSCNGFFAANSEASLCVWADLCVMHPMVAQSSNALVIDREVHFEGKLLIIFTAKGGACPRLSITYRIVDGLARNQ
jgi:hypothetical protein